VPQTNYSKILSQDGSSKTGRRDVPRLSTANKVIYLKNQTMNEESGDYSRTNEENQPLKRLVLPKLMNGSSRKRA